MHDPSNNSTETKYGRAALDLLGGWKVDENKLMGE